MNNHLFNNNAIAMFTGVEFSFTNDDFHAGELGEGGTVSLMPVRVVKNVRIASRIELVVVPLTVQEARGTAHPLPPNIPDDDPFSPPFASKLIFYRVEVVIISAIQIWMILTTQASPLSLSLMRMGH